MSPIPSSLDLCSAQRRARRPKTSAPRKEGQRRKRAGRPPNRIAGWQARGEAGARHYQRLRDLPGLIALWPAEIADPSLPAARQIVGLLEKALRHERRRGISGHWSYDLSRHMALSAALKAEKARLKALEKAAR